MINRVYVIECSNPIVHPAYAYVLGQPLKGLKKCSFPLHPPGTPRMKIISPSWPFYGKLKENKLQVIQVFFWCGQFRKLHILILLQVYMQISIDTFIIWIWQSMVFSSPLTLRLIKIMHNALFFLCITPLLPEKLNRTLDNVASSVSHSSHIPSIYVIRSSYQTPLFWMRLLLQSPVLFWYSWQWYQTMYCNYCAVHSLHLSNQHPCRSWLNPCNLRNKDLLILTSLS